MTEYHALPHTNFCITVYRSNLRAPLVERLWASMLEVEDVPARVLFQKQVRRVVLMGWWAPRPRRYVHGWAVRLLVVTVGVGRFTNDPPTYQEAYAQHDFEEDAQGFPVPPAYLDTVAVPQRVVPIRATMARARSLSRYVSGPLTRSWYAGTRLVHVHRPTPRVISEVDRFVYVARVLRTQTRGTWGYRVKRAVRW